MWTDPDWEQMLKESELIALVEVIEGGKFVAKVKTLTTFKGSPGPEFYVTGFNNHNWPEDAIKLESFGKKARYYLFATRRDDSVQYLEFLAGADTGFIQTLADFLAPILGGRSSNGEVDAGLEAAKTGHLWSVWTPSAGDLPVDGEKVHYSLLNPSYPHQATARDRAEFEQFLKAALAYHVHTQTAPALLDKALQAVKGEAAKPDSPGESVSPAPSEQPSNLSHWLATYFLLGGRAYNEVFETIAAGKDVNARFMLARLLGRITEKPARKLLLAMLKDSGGVVQGEVVRQLAKGDSKEVGPILLAHLSGAAEDGSGPQGLMDPVRNLLDSGKTEIIRALGELKYEPAAPALISLLEVAGNEYELKVLADALEKMGNRDYAPALEKRWRSGNMRVFEIADQARDHRLTHLKPVFERLLQNPPDGTMTIHLTSVVEALGVIGDEATAIQLTAHLEKLNAKKVAEVHDQSMAMQLIGSLGALRYEPARSAVEQSFFYWFGIDSAFAAKPELLKTKERLEQELEREAKKSLGEFGRVDAEALVFLENRAALAAGSESESKYRFVLHADVRSPEHPELKAESLRTRLVQALGIREGTISVTRWNGHMGASSGGSDERVSGRNDGLFLWRYGQYVEATRGPQDLRFVKFLMESGLAESWGGREGLEEGLGATPKP